MPAVLQPVLPVRAKLLLAQANRGSTAEIEDEA
jgi:hypothetical protein